MAVAIVDLDNVRSQRVKNRSRGNQAGNVEPFERVLADISICEPCSPSEVTEERQVHIHKDLDEIKMGPPLWMWDYLRRSGARGFFLPLSGGADSASVAAMVASMAMMVYESVTAGNQDTLADLRKIVRKNDFMPSKYQDIVNEVMVTSYLSTVNSGADTRGRAQRLADDIGTYHFNISIDQAYESIKAIFTKATDKEPKFLSQ